LNHRTTIMLTTDHELTLRGDCIAAVFSEKGLGGINPNLRNTAKNEKARITLKLEIGDQSLEVNGKGHPDLTWEDPADMVARKSEYICPRTLMIKADLASFDVPRGFVDQLKNDLQQVSVTITVEL